MLTLTKSTGRSKEEVLKQSKSQRQESHKISSTLHYFTTTFAAPKGPLHSVTPPQHKTMIYHKQEENTCSKVHFLRVPTFPYEYYKDTVQKPELTVACFFC